MVFIVGFSRYIWLKLIFIWIFIKIIYFNNYSFIISFKKTKKDNFDKIYTPSFYELIEMNFSFKQNCKFKNFNFLYLFLKYSFSLQRNSLVIKVWILAKYLCFLLDFNKQHIHNTLFGLYSQELGSSSSKVIVLQNHV